MKDQKLEVDFNTYQQILMAAMFDDTLEEVEVPDTPKNRQILKEVLILIDEAEKSGQIIEFPS